MPTTTITASDLGHLYLDLHHRLHRLVDDAMTSSGLSMARAKVLMQLAADGPMNQAAIAARLGLAARSITDTIDSLERDGQAARESDPRDRRAWLVAITPSGRAALDRAQAAKFAAMDQIFESLDVEQRTQFAALLTSIRASVAGEIGACNAR